MDMPNLLKYSNGWGHLVMSVTSQIVAVILLLQHDPTLNGTAIGLIITVTGYWFVTSTANAQKHIAQPTAPAAAPATPGGENGTTHP